MPSRPLPASTVLLLALLVTPTGVEWLSRAPREPAEIESAMAHRGR